MFCNAFSYFSTGFAQLSTALNRFLVAMPLLELNKAVEEAAASTFNPDLPRKELTQILSFQSDTVVYFKSYWLNRSTEPKQETQTLGIYRLSSISPNSKY